MDQPRTDAFKKNHASGQTLIEVRDIAVECIIGVYEAEKIKPQRVVVDIALMIDGRRAAESDDLKDTVNYASLSHEIIFILQQARFELLESAVRFLASSLLTRRSVHEPRVLSATVTLRKPEALGPLGLAVVSTTVTEEEVSSEQQVTALGPVQLVAANRKVMLIAKNVTAADETMVYTHGSETVAEMVLPLDLDGAGSVLGTRHPCGKYRSFQGAGGLRWLALLPQGSLEGLRLHDDLRQQPGV
jgi:dihydroneopterin aldolase